MRKVVGVHSAKEVLKVRPKSVVKIHLKKQMGEFSFFSKWAEEKKVPLEIQRETKLFEMSSCRHHQGVLVETNETPSFRGFDSLSEENVQALILDSLESPHNLGAILRTAWLMGVEVIFIPSKASVKLNSTVMKVAEGGAEHVPVVSMSLIKTLCDSRETGFWSYGLSEKGNKSLWDESLDLGGRVLWVAGSEKKGIRRPLLKQCDHLIYIPQVQKEASFNVSVAVSLALAESYRKRVLKA